LLIGVGLLGRYIAKGGAEAGLKTVWFDSVDDVTRQVSDLLQVKDVVLIKGSRAMRMERLIPPIKKAFAKKNNLERMT
jgi:UDP-N-acetylmuramyl pentapeptide synthase